MYCDIEDDDVEDIIRRLFRYYEQLVSHRRKLHGFLIALDYTSRTGSFSLDADGDWMIAVPEIDIFISSFEGYQIIESLVESRPLDNIYCVTGLNQDESRDTRPLYSRGNQQNIQELNTLIHSWYDRQDRSRPVTFHSLSPLEQLRLAHGAAVTGGAADSFLLVDLNYCWYSATAPFLGCFGGDCLTSLLPGIEDDSVGQWQEAGRRIFEGHNQFSWQDSIAWLGESFKAYSRIMRREGVTPCLIVTGAEHINRFGRKLAEGLLAPMHEKGELLVLFLSDKVPKRRRGQLSYTEFRKAPVREEHQEPAALDRDENREEQYIRSLGELFSPFLTCSELRSALYAAGFAKHKVDKYFIFLAEAGQLLKSWRYFFPGSGTSCRDGKAKFKETELAPFLSENKEHIPAVFRMEYAALAVSLRPNLGELHYKFLLNALYEMRDSVTGSTVAGILSGLPGRLKDYYRMARNMQNAFTDGSEVAETQFRGSEQDISTGSHVQVLKIENFLRMNRVDSALSEAKTFLFDVQGEGDFCRITEAQHALGTVMLRKGRVEEANDYFTLAYESSKSCAAPVDRVRACVSRALGLFLFGNYSRADRLLSEAIGISCGLSHGSFLLFARFLKGRIAFKLGRYAVAEKELWEALSLATLTGVPHSVFYAWIARSRIYTGQCDEGIEMLCRLNKTGEVLYFLAEGYFFNHNEALALTSIRRAQRRVKFETEHTDCLSRNCWDSGFRNVEDYAFRAPSGRGVLLNCVTAFRWLLESRTGSDVKDGTAILEHITRGEKLGELDPYLYYYYLIHALLISEETHDENLERITYLSKGLKYLQRTSSVIDDVPSRLEYLSKNRWNKYLMDMARREKLA